jgi:hypothetical protein
MFTADNAPVPKDKNSKSRSSVGEPDEEKVSIAVDYVADGDDDSECIDAIIITKAEDVAVQVRVLNF